MVKNWFKQSEITIFEKIYGGNAEECLDSPDEIPSFDKGKVELRNLADITIS